jgi:predicted TPR repeat methyltransferase
MTDEKSDPKGPSDFVDQAYHLEDAESTVDFYRRWAADYDHQMLDLLGYISPYSIAGILAEQLPDRSASILDVGCGTGLTCRVLAERGYDRLDGIDLSAEMLAVARERGIYRELLEADITQPLALESASYDGVISSGTFTHGHVGPEPLREIFRVLKPGGVLACTVHLDLWQSMGFEAEFDSLTRQGIAARVSAEPGSFYRDKPAEGLFCVYRKLQPSG